MTSEERLILMSDDLETVLRSIAIIRGVVIATVCILLPLGLWKIGELLAWWLL